MKRVRESECEELTTPQWCWSLVRVSMQALQRVEPTDVRMLIADLVIQLWFVRPVRIFDTNVQFTFCLARGHDALRHAVIAHVPCLRRIHGWICRDHPSGLYGCNHPVGDLARPVAMQRCITKLQSKKYSLLLALA